MFVLVQDENEAYVHINLQLIFSIELISEKQNGFKAVYLLKTSVEACGFKVKDTLGKLEGYLRSQSV